MFNMMFVQNAPCTQLAQASQASRQQFSRLVFVPSKLAPNKLGLALIFQMYRTRFQTQSFDEFLCYAKGNGWRKRRSDSISTLAFWSCNTVMEAVMETPAAPERLWPRYVRVVEALVCIRVFFVVVRGCPRRLAAEVDYWSLLGSALAFLWLAHT